MRRSWPRIGLLVLLLFTLLLGWQATQLPYRYAVQDLFPAGDPAVQAYDSLRAAFPAQGRYLGLGVRPGGSVFEAGFLVRLDSFSQALRQLPPVAGLTSLTEARFRRRGPLGNQRDLPLVHPYRPERLARDSAWVMAMPLFRYSYVAPDARTTCLYLRLAEGPLDLAQLARQVDSLCLRYELGETALTGGPYSAFRQETRLRHDMWQMGALSLLWVLGMLGWAFRRWWGVALPLLIIGLSTLWTLGLMRLLGGELNLMTILLPTLLFVVGTSDVIHLLMQYREDLARGLAPAEAVRHTRRTTGLALLLTSLTTALGFLTLRLSAAGPFGELGVYAALGVMVAYGLTVLLLPPLLPYLAVAPAPPRSRRRWVWYALWRYRRGWRALALVLALVALPGLAQLKVEAFFSRELRPHTAEAREIAFFEQHLGGTRPLLVGFSAAEGHSLWEPAMVQALARVEDYLVDSLGLNRPYSLVRELRALHSVLDQGRVRAYRLPEGPDDLASLITSYRLYVDSAQQRSLITPDGRLTRLEGTLPDLGIREMARRQARLDAYLATHPLPPGLAVHLSGEATLLDRSHQLFVQRLGGGLLLALGVVALLMGLLFRSWRMACLAILPNLLPLLLIAGGMGWAGLGLNMSTAIIFTIGFGIAVDDSIHFLSRLYVERRQGRALPMALRQTWFATGRAMLWTTAVLAGGFLALLGSSFQGTWLTGLLVSLTLVLALVGDLILLPVLLLGKKRPQGSRAKRI